MYSWIKEKIIDFFKKNIIVHFEKDFNTEEELYPCKNCIVLPAGCRELCDKIEMDNEIISKRIEKEKCCPDCGGKKFYDGPCGGASQNIECAKCRHRFNFYMFGFERIGV